MPRNSAESLSAAMYRHPKSPPEPPTDLTAEGKKLWRETVRDKQADWFNPVSTRLLHILIQQLCLCNDLQRQYDAMELCQVSGIVLKQLLATSANCASIAARLRLTPQQQIDRRSGKITETGLGDAVDDRLLGGSAAWGSAPTKKVEPPDV